MFIRGEFNVILAVLQKHLKCDKDQRAKVGFGAGEGFANLVT